MPFKFIDTTTQRKKRKEKKITGILQENIKKTHCLSLKKSISKGTVY